MRRTVLTVVGAVLLATAVMTVISREAAHPATTTTAPTTTVRTSFTVTPFGEHQVSASPPGEVLGQVLTYVGDLHRSKTDPANMGSYRATCEWLGEEKISGVTVRRVECVIFLRLASSTSTGGTLVAQGQVERPATGNLLGGSSNPQLAITGGTGQFRAAGGWIDVTSAGLTIEVVQSW